MFGNKYYIKYFPSISNHKCTLSDRQMYHLGNINSRLGTPALDGSILLKFLLETRLNESFETLDDLQSFGFKS